MRVRARAALGGCWETSAVGPASSAPPWLEQANLVRLTPQESLQRGSYSSPQAVAYDLFLIWANAREYNEQGSMVYADADKLEVRSFLVWSTLPWRSMLTDPQARVHRATWSVSGESVRRPSRPSSRCLDPALSLRHLLPHPKPSASRA